jgi:hypothetical protein
VLTQLWTGVGGKLTDRVATVLFSPAFAFGVAGLLAWLSSRGGPRSWPGAVAGLSRRAEGPVELQILGVLAVLVAVLLAGRLVDWFVPVTLRLLEGYWPRPAAPVRRWLAGRVARRRHADHARWNAMQWPQGEPEPEATAELVRLDRRLRRVPLLTQQIMPTRLGNVLRASESRPARKYGIDPVVCWPHLWVLLPDVVRGEVAAARARLDAATATVLWGTLIAVWAIWSWWAVPVALVVAVSGYVAAVRAAAVFGDLVEAAWDLYRAEVYRALRWPLPQNPAEEYTAGRNLTRYLRRGGRGTSPTFGRAAVSSAYEE